ncbi:MAG TPA: UvrD-helicase domain-containing protein [Thermoanaerobaculia bacterium]|nr:UvrD-helicase domain-containing protein [Thermoanaerobaculia bacterium]
MTGLQQTFRFNASAATPPSRQNLVVEAGAGTGKTTAIVAEVLKLLLGKETAAPERIVLMTFTEKAAGEIADRIHAALAELELHFDDERVAWPVGSSNPLFVVPEGLRDVYRRACAQQIARIDTIRSQTIHSFCQSLLRSHPIEAGLDPQFKIIEGFERSLLYGQLYDAWFDHETRVDPNPRTLQEWEFLLAHVGYLFQIRDLVFSLLARRDLLMEAEYDFGSLDEIEGELSGSLTVIRRSDLSGVTDGHALTLFRYIQEVEPPRRGSIDAWLDYFSPVAVPLRKANLPKDPALKEALVTLRTDRDKTSSIHERLLRHRSTLAMHALTRRFIDFLDAEKRKLGVVDFDDLLLRALELLQNERVLDHVRQQFDHIFVDEFQDTDRTQARIIEKLGTDRHGAWVPGKVTLVGDPKQSIYGFRRADPETYRSMTARLLEAGATEQIILDHYRSDPPLLEAINAMFTSVFADADSDPNVFRPPYRPLRAARPDAGDRAGDDPRLTFLHASHDEKSDRHLSEAEAIAEWIEANRDRAGRDLRPFAILFRRTTKLDDYLDTFDRYGIEYVLPPTKSFLDRRAPVDAVAVLRAIARPFDRGAEISAARTPYFALTDQEIVEGILSDPEARGPRPEAWSSFQSALEAYRDAAAHRTVSQTLDLLIESTAIETTCDALLDGRRARRHLEHLRTLAFQYDQKIGGSLRQFIDEIERRREEPDEIEPSLADDDSNAVRIMTVHAAKGLEFETVILPDLVFPTRGGGDKQQLFVVENPRSLVMTGRAQSLSAHFRFTPRGTRLKSVGGEREEAETRRLFYVAVTRAISGVVFVCNTASFKKDGFFACLAGTFGFDKDSFASMWPEEPGRRVHVWTDGIPLAFEKMSIRDVTRRSMGRLHDAALEQRLATGELVEAAIQPPLIPAEAAMAQASSKSRAAGTLLHRFLERWQSDDDSGALLAKLAAEMAAAPAVVDTVRRRVASLRRSETFLRIERATTVGREIPIRFAGEQGELVEKRIDRLIREDGRDIVIDYKSGQSSDERLPADRDQVARYCRAIEAMTARPCEGWRWYIDVDADERLTV